MSLILIIVGTLASQFAIYKGLQYTVKMHITN
jgi:hypothetical protein